MAAATPCTTEEGTDGMFCMDEDFGFFEDLDADADDATAPSDDESVMSIPCCGASRIEDGDADSLRAAPPLLTPQMVDAIAEEGLPWSLQDASWARLFVSSRDGASFREFMRRVRGRGPTIVVAKTAAGKIVGGYAPDAWTGRKAASPDDKASRAFLFSVDTQRRAPKRPASPPTFLPGLEELGTSPASAADFDAHRVPASPSKGRREVPRVEICRAARGLKQACRLGDELLSLTDEDAGLGLVIDRSFSHGTVAHAREDEEDCAVVAFEVYGFED